MLKIAFATYDNNFLSKSDTLLIEPLFKLGIKVQLITWDNLNINWKHYDAIIIRSIWDYHLKYQKFLIWLETIKKLYIHVANPVNILKWNTNKNYLLDLANQGVKCIPTLFIDKNNLNKLNNYLLKNNWKEIMIKPNIGASAYKIKKFSLSQSTTIFKYVENIIENGIALIQPVIPQLQVNGEYSFIFINKQFSHAVLKKPKSGEFRSNYHFGSQNSLIEANQNLISQAEKIINIIPKPLLYARVDAANIDGSLMLVELELTEPHLFLDLYPPSAQKFSSQISSFINQQR
jgi:glutathione synthase/RimK-type ligase-like ATP-grasp enzyme